MRTQVLQDAALGTPCLERDADDGSTERIALQSLPFTIGRSDRADLRIESSQVSREHAEISRHRMRYRVRDLHSTNGTFLNGQRIEEATLTDGDLLAIADVEFTFVSGGEGPSRQTVTQVMGGNAGEATSDGVASEIIRAVRRANEAVTHRGLRVLFQPVAELASGEVFAYEAHAASGDDVPHPRCAPLGEGVECRTVNRLRQLYRRLIAETALVLPQGAGLLVAVDGSELVGSRLLGPLAQLRGELGQGRQLIVEIADNAVRPTAEFRTLLCQLREAGIQIAYDGYASGKAHILEREHVAPDFLKLAPTIFRGIHRGGERQRLVHSIVQASHDLDCVVIATGVDNLSDLEVCRELGCRLAQGELFGPPQSASVLLHTAAVPGTPRPAAMQMS